MPRQHPLPLAVTMARKRVRCDDSDCEEEAIIEAVGTNKVFFHADVSRTTIFKLIEAVHDARSRALEAGDKVIWLFIHSGGGCLHSGFSGMDHLRALCSDIELRTVADGAVASAASLLLLAGARRYAMPHAVLLLHQLSTAACGKFEELHDDYINNSMLMDALRAEYQRCSKMDAEAIGSRLRRELLMSAQQAMEVGLVDELYQPARNSIPVSAVPKV